MLIVVGILAILASLLMPSLSKARESAQIAVCLSNLSQHEKAQSGYLKSSNGRFPAIQSAAMGGDWVSNWAGIKGRRGKSYSDRPYNKFMGVKSDEGGEHLLCPSKSATAKALYAIDGTSYAFNKGWNANSLGKRRNRGVAFLSQVNHSTMMVSSMEWSAYLTFHWRNISAHYHNRKLQYNLGFIDGHVEKNKQMYLRKDYVANEYSFNNKKP